MASYTHLFQDLNVKRLHLCVRSCINHTVRSTAASLLFKLTGNSKSLVRAFWFDIEKRITIDRSCYYQFQSSFLSNRVPVVISHTALKSSISFTLFRFKLTTFFVYTLCVSEPKKILSAASAPHVRHKRNILQFGNMVTCVTEKNSLDYSDYGCNCGMGGMGQPVDELDW